MNIGSITINGKFGLAPMAGVTDMAFRLMCVENGAAWTVSEMVSSRALVYQDKKSRALLPRATHAVPYGVQIFGNDPDIMAAAAKIVAEISEADFIDINMGCPTPKIVAAGDGCGLMRTPELAGRIVEAVKAAVSLPVTVKMRKGWDKGSVNAVELAKIVEAAGASAVAIHGRTRTQMYGGTADWDIIRQVRESVNIPVLANGDIVGGESAAHILRYTGCEAAMIGRSAFGDPWIFAEANAAVTGESYDRPPLEGRMDTALRQFEINMEQKGEVIACLEARKHLCWYLHGIPYSNYYKDIINQMKTAEDIYNVVGDIKRDLK